VPVLSRGPSKEVNMKEWNKPAIRSMDERELLKQLSVKADSGPGHVDGHDDSHNDAHNNVH